MQREVTFAGFGGQGVMLIGQMLAYSGMDENKQVSWLPSYGPEMRGGTAYCTVVVSDKPIGSPVVITPEVAVVMNRPSLDKFGPTVRKSGYLFINSSLIDVSSDRKDIKVILVPCNQLAIEAGSAKSANIVMIGALIGATGIVKPETIEGRIDYAFKRKGEEIVKMNVKAFRCGVELGKSGAR